MPPRSIGVEEELMLVDPDTRLLLAAAARAADAPDLEQELFKQQVETTTQPQPDADGVDAEIRRQRRTAGETAAAAGARAVAMPAPVLAQDSGDFTRKPRYQRIQDEYGELASQALVNAMHIHIDVADDDEGVGVIDRIRPWLPVLVALSANSPYWQGRDTGHASWRSQLWSRWPSAGPQQPFGDAATYRATSADLIGWGASLDPGMLYFDIRLAQHYPTVEIRVADVCTEVDDAVLVALLCRALVDTEARAWHEDAPADPWRADLLRAAGWRAARYGGAGPLVHPVEGKLSPTRHVVNALVDHVRPALEEAGDAERVSELYERLVARGGGATRQRSVFEATGELSAVVDDLVRRTEESWH